MQLLKRLFVFIMSLFVLTGCQTMQNDEPVSDIDTLGMEFTGQWQVVPRVIPYGALLTVDSNYSFTYMGGACLMHFGSSGIWHTLGDTLVLDSRDTSACLYTNTFGVNCIPLNSSYTRTRTIEGCEPEDDFFEYIIFNNERFLLSNDTIFNIPRVESLCPEIKDNFYRFRKRVD